MQALGLQLDGEVKLHVQIDNERLVQIAGKYVQFGQLMSRATGDPQVEEELDRLSRELAKQAAQAREESQLRLVALLAHTPEPARAGR